MRHDYDQKLALYKSLTYLLIYLDVFCRSDNKRIRTVIVNNYFDGFVSHSTTCDKTETSIALL